jgi:hypothetical protein
MENKMTKGWERKGRSTRIRYEGMGEQETQKWKDEKLNEKGNQNKEIERVVKKIQSGNWRRRRCNHKKIEID